MPALQLEGYPLLEANATGFPQFLAFGCLLGRPRLHVHDLRLWDLERRNINVLSMVTLGSSLCSLFRAAAVFAGHEDNVNKAINTTNNRSPYEDADKYNYYHVPLPVEVVLALSDAIPVLSVDDFLITALSGACRERSLVDQLIIFIFEGAVAPDEIVAGCVVVGHVECTTIV